MRTIQIESLKDFMMSFPMPVAPNLSHLNLQTQIVHVLYIMSCPSDLLDLVDPYAEAGGDTTLLDLENIEESGLIGTDSRLDEIVAAAKQGGFKTIALTQ